LASLGGFLSMGSTASITASRRPEYFCFLQLPCF
jgi:hypothetical protein